MEEVNIGTRTVCVCVVHACIGVCLCPSVCLCVLRLCLCVYVCMYALACMCLCNCAYMGVDLKLTHEPISFLRKTYSPGKDNYSSLSHIAVHVVSGLINRIPVCIHYIRGGELGVQT